MLRACHASVTILTMSANLRSWGPGPEYLSALASDLKIAGGRYLRSGGRSYVHRTEKLKSSQSGSRGSRFVLSVATQRRRIKVRKVKTLGFSARAVPPVILVVLTASMLGCCQGTEIQGKWQCGVALISIYKDGVASFGGNRASWTALGNGAIRLEYQESDQATVGELEVRGKDEAGLRTATLSFGSLTTNCSELPAITE